MTLPLGAGLMPVGELVRRVEGVRGSVPLVWSMCARFGFGLEPTSTRVQGGVPVSTSGNDALAVLACDAGPARVDAAGVGGSFVVSEGDEAMIALAMAHQEPLVLPNRADVERRLDATIAFWRGWTQRRTIPAGRREASVRSALALKLLVHSPTGAVAAAATTSLPEEIGGERNWDYRFSWLRDSAFVMEALLALGCRDEAEAFFWWLMHASQITQPRLQVLYRLDGSARAAERTLPLEGYKGSTPVRVGNLAAEQYQLDIYGDLLQTAWLYAQAGHGIDREFGDRLAAIADLVTEIWREPDAGIWEVRGEPRHFTQSKMLCWVALDRARRLADDGFIPAGHTDSWRTTAKEIETFVEERCWSSEVGSYTQAVGSEALDASVLLGARLGYGDPAGPRFRSTIAALQRDLAEGVLLHRYRGDDGLRGRGGSLPVLFVLARGGPRHDRPHRRGEATMLDELIGLANDVGLYAEETRPHIVGVPRKLPAGADAPRAASPPSRRLTADGPMTIWAALAGGFVGTLVLTTILRARASSVGPGSTCLSCSARC